jgi:hypothetical protein
MDHHNDKKVVGVFVRFRAPLASRKRAEAASTGGRCGFFCPGSRHPLVGVVYLNMARLQLLTLRKERSVWKGIRRGWPWRRSMGFDVFIHRA